MIQISDPSESATASTLPVECVRISVLTAPLEDQVPMSFGGLQARQVCVVQVCAGGLEGMGESWINYPPWAPAERMATLTQGVAPRLIGMDAADPAGVLDGLAAALLPVGRQAGAPGVIWQALSGVDIAMWDLAAQAAGRPVHELLRPASSPAAAQNHPRPRWDRSGNEHSGIVRSGDNQSGTGGPGARSADTASTHCGSRTHIAAYASGVGPTAVTSCCESALRQGLTAVKAKIGFGPDRDAEILRTARDMIGPRRRLFADPNQAWDLDTAITMLPTLAKYGVEWLEEPLAGDDLTDLEHLANAGSPDIATGENVYELAEFARRAASPGIEILQPDLAKSGGLSVGRQVAEHASAGGTVVAPHCYSSAIGLAAAAQLGAAYPVVDWLELDVRDNPLRTDLLTQPLSLDDGALRVPAGAGLGIELDPVVLDRFRTHYEEVT